MRNKLISKLLLGSVVASNLLIVHPENVFAADLSSTEQNNVLSITSTLSEDDTVTSDEYGIAPCTAYDWKVSNLGVSSWGSSQIEGPMSGGSFNTEGAWGNNRTITVSWSGAPSNARFKIKAVGQDSSNSGKTTYSGYCTASSGSTTITIPYASAGVINLYVDNYSAATMNLTTVHVDSR